MYKVIITKIPLRYYFYYQWLILGFYKLQQNNELKLKIKLRTPFHSLLCYNYKIFLGLRKYFGLFRGNKKQNDYLLEGYIEFDGKKQQFVYDIADTPYYFNVSALNEDVKYFKAQCPKYINEKGFSLTPDVFIPYHPDAIKNKHKILPSMLGPGGWGYNIFSYKSLNQGYNNLFLSEIKKGNKLMCYFGGNKGPIPEFSYLPDLYLEESHILSFFKNDMNHPNEKRARAAQIITEQGKGYDGRIIKIFDQEGKLEKNNQHLFIPLKEYTQHISSFSYNLNISGFRKSIPNRFIYSFCVGTAIVTDKLSVKWYKPFDNEVIELDEMGYLPNDHVDWDSFTKSIINLPEIDYKKVVDNFSAKWSPEAFARYVVDTCTK